MAMLWIVIALIAGIALGFLLRNAQKVVAVFEKTAMFSVFLLLFFLGLSVGSNRLLLQKLPQMGFSALVITLCSIFFSVILSFVVYLLLFKKKSGECDD